MKTWLKVSGGIGLFLLPFIYDSFIPKVCEMQYSLDEKERVLAARLKENGIEHAEEIIATVVQSTPLRMKEYEIAEEDYYDLVETTIFIGAKQTAWEHRTWSYPEPTNELWRERQYSIVDKYTSIIPNTVSYGPLQLQSRKALKNAENLGTYDYHNPTQLTGNLEEAVKHSQREIAHAWKRYCDQRYEIPYEEKLAVVAFAYNRGYDTPFITAVQFQLDQIGFNVGFRDGHWGTETKNALLQFCEQNMCDDQEEINSLHSDEEIGQILPKLKVYTTLREQYYQKHWSYYPETSLQINEYVYFYIPEVLDACWALTGVKERCTLESLKKISSDQFSL